MRQLNSMYHIEGEQLVKTSNGQAIPEDEPVFILRARDRVAIHAIRIYVVLCQVDMVDDERVEQLFAVIDRFCSWMMLNPGKVKQPGITKGR